MFTFHFPALEKEMATHSSVLAWRIPGTSEPGGLPSMGLHRVEHDWSNLAAAAAAAAAAALCAKIAILWKKKTVKKLTKYLWKSYHLKNLNVIQIYWMTLRNWT